MKKTTKKNPNDKIEPYKDISEIYDEVRPSYPQELIDDLLEFSQLSHNANLLEIGAGTGKATTLIAPLGFNIHAIEIGADMGYLLNKKCKSFSNVTTEINAFENVHDFEMSPYDMIYSAQAFHWLDPKIKYEKCANLLKANGILALFWYSPQDQSSEKAMIIESEISSLLLNYLPNDNIALEKPTRKAHKSNDSCDSRREEILNSKYFDLLQEFTYDCKIKNDSKQYWKIKKSIPAFQSKLDMLSADCNKELESKVFDILEKHGGYIETNLRYTMFIAQKSK